MYVNNLQSVLPSCANIADCSGWAPPNLPPPWWGGRGAPEERLSLSPPLRTGLCLPEQLYGNNSHWRRLFPRREGGGCGCPVGEGLWGLPRAGASSWGAGGEGSGPRFSSQSPCKGRGPHPAPGMRQAAPRCPHTSHRSSVPHSCPSSPTGPDPGHVVLWGQPGAAGGMPGGAGGQSPLPSLLPSPLPQPWDPPSAASSGGLLAISYSSRVLAGGGRAAAGAPKWLQSVALRHDRRGSGAAAGSGSRLPDKGPGTKARLPHAPGKGRRRVRGRGAGLAWGLPLSPDPQCPPCPGAHPAPTLAGTARMQSGTRWHSPGTGPVPPPPTSAVPGTAPGAGLCCGPSLALYPPALPISGCSGAEMRCSGAQGYRDGAESTDAATAEDDKRRAGPPSPTVPQFPQLLLWPL